MQVLLSFDNNILYFITDRIIIILSFICRFNILLQVLIIAGVINLIAGFIFTSFVLEFSSYKIKILLEIKFYKLNFNKTKILQDEKLRRGR